MPKLIDRTKQKYGHWQPLRYLGGSKWLCQCVCGTVKAVPTVNLSRGTSTNCGCIQRLSNKERMSTHGKSKTKLYGVWMAIKRRCFKSYDKEFSRYGGRGITMCKEWQSNYTTFETWAMANGYRESLQIDRIDNDANYCPENCRWVTQKQNARNKSNNRLVMYQGEMQPLPVVAEKINISAKLLESRMLKGWTLEEAIKYPAKKGNNQKLRGVENGKIRANQ